MPAVALVAPQSWYYATVPADLSWAAGALRAAGHTVEVFDLAARIQHDLLGATPAWNTLRDPEALDDPDHHRQAALALFDHCAPIANRFQVRLSPTTLAFPDADGTHLPTSLRVGLDPSETPPCPPCGAPHST